MASKQRTQVTDGTAARLTRQIIELETAAKAKAAQTKALKAKLTEQYGAGGYETSTGTFDVQVVEASVTADMTRLRAEHPQLALRLLRKWGKTKAGYIKVTVRGAHQSVAVKAV